MSPRTALITGASAGIGFSLVKAFLSDGYKVVAVARTMGNLEELSVKGDSHDRSLEFIKGDLSNKEGCDRVIENLANKSEINVVIHNVGGARERGSLFSLSDSSWSETMFLNVMQAVLITKGIWKTLISSENPRMLFIGSLVATEPGNFDPHYSAAKAALLNFAKHVAKLGADKQLLVNTVLPGPILTESFAEFVAHTDKERTLNDKSFSLENELISKIPLKRLGHTSDLDEISTFLCSERNKWITGATIKVDGGKSSSIL